jgi:hypothetical protein
MNYRQRIQNRATAAELTEKLRQARLMAHTCENCGRPGGHWISTRGPSLAALLAGRDDQTGFWACEMIVRGVDFAKTTR